MACSMMKAVQRLKTHETLFDETNIPSWYIGVVSCIESFVEIQRGSAMNQCQLCLEYIVLKYSMLGKIQDAGNAGL
jgi:hypothetical protein